MNEPESVWRIVLRIFRKAGWAPIAVLLVHAAGGHFFGHEPYVDPAMHFLGGLAAAYFFWHAGALGGRRMGSPSPLALDMLAFGLTCAIALVWELGEFFSDLYLGTNIQRSVANTMRDLALGMSGAIVYVAVIQIRRMRGKKVVAPEIDGA